MQRTHLDAVLKDLRSNREVLLGNLKHVNHAIACLEKLYNLDTKPLEVKPEPIPEPVLEESELQDPEADLLQHNMPSMGLVQTIEIAAKEGKWDQSQLAHRVVALRKGTPITTAQSQISSMLHEAKRRLHKGEDLIVRWVQDGKVQGLPEMSEKDRAFVITRMPQYETR